MIGFFALYLNLMNHPIIFFDGPQRDQLLPLTYLRPTCHLMVGRQTIAEQWLDQLNTAHAYLVPSYLTQLYPNSMAQGRHLYINGSALPNEALIDEIDSIDDDTVLSHQDSPIAFYSDSPIASLDMLAP